MKTLTSSENLYRLLAILILVFSAFADQNWSKIVLIILVLFTAAYETYVELKRDNKPTLGSLTMLYFVTFIPTLFITLFVGLIIEMILSPFGGTLFH